MSEVLRISALTFIKMVDDPSKLILVICTDPKIVLDQTASLIREILDLECLYHRDGTYIRCTKGEMHFLSRQECYDDKMPKIRGDIILVEGLEEDYTDEFKKTVLTPLQSLPFNPRIYQTLSERIEGQIPDHWINRPEIIYSEKYDQ